MNTGPLIAEIAALVGDPARATMLTALLDGRALTATELAHAARITPQTASTHLAKLTEAGLLTALRDGRHRYFQLGSPKIFEMLDAIMVVAVENRPRFRPLSREAREVNDARICYVHLAGRLSVDIADFFTTHKYIVTNEGAAEITPAGTRFLGAFGIEAFTPILNAPEAAILGIGRIQRQPVVLGESQISIQDVVTLSLTFDHRIVDGAPAARFLQRLVEMIKNPAAWLVG